MKALATLPRAVQRIARTVAGPVAERVLLQQAGEMRQRPDGRWLKFRGEEELTVASVGFRWKARFRVFPGVWMEVEDAFSDGFGKLEGRLWGRLRLFESLGPDADVAQAMRYLAELPWVPSAFAHNSELQWTELDEGRVRVSTDVHGQSVFVDLSLDEDGRVRRVFTPGRMMGSGRSARMMPWGGIFGDYVEFDGMLIPRIGEVYWELPEGRFTYWRGEILAVKRAGEVDQRAARLV